MTDKTQAPQVPQDTAAVATAVANTITLDQPIQRGDTAITAVTLRRPMAGELRGIKLTELLQLDVGALAALLPRITAPALTPHDVASLDPADLTELGAHVAGFFVRKSIRAEFQSA